MSLLGTLVWHALLLEDAPAARRGLDRSVAGSGSGMRAFAALALCVLVVQIALGGWVSANYAVLACTDFPTCQGVWIPQMDFLDGFQPWRELGKAADGSYLSVAALTAIHWTHRGFAVVVFLVLGALAWWLRKTAGVARPAGVLAVLLVAQCATGLVNVVFAWPLVAAVLHNAGAAGLLTTLVVINYRLPRRSQATRLHDPSPSAPEPSGLSKLGRTAS
jgi:cytochrome c oxidase assembly protein subunit 15